MTVLGRLESPIWREKENLLRSVPGVGEQVSVTLLAYLPELKLDRRRIAARWGLRLSIGTVAACGANAACGADVRECGAHCTCTGSQQVEPGDLYQRLLKAGKPKKIALVPVWQAVDNPPPWREPTTIRRPLLIKTVALCGLRKAMVIPAEAGI